MMRHLDLGEKATAFFFLMGEFIEREPVDDEWWVESGSNGVLVMALPEGRRLGDGADARIDFSEIRISLVLLE